MYIEIDMPRGQSMLSSHNSSRELSIHSNTSFMAYIDIIQVLANSPMWAKQVESIELQSFAPALSYVTVRERTNNTTSMVPVVKPISSYYRYQQHIYISRPRTISYLLHQWSIYGY